LEGLMMNLQFLLIHIHGGTVLELIPLLYSYALANEVFNFFRVNIMSSTVEKDSF
jgi:hypothetical protein